MGHVGTRWPLALALLLAPGWAAAAPAEDEPPVADRPDDGPFSGAVGAFQVRAAAAPTDVPVRSPFTLTLTVSAAGPVRRRPDRIDLRQVPSLAAAFHVEDPEVGARQVSTAPPTWEFTYRLKPKSRRVTEVPGLPFVYYRPDIPFPAKRYQVRYTDPIPLTVRDPEVVGVPLQAPEGAFALATGPGVLARQAPWRPPGPAEVAGLVLAPPLACAAWYIAWRRRYPDAARQARQRRSRAARQALHALRGADRLPPGPQAERAAAAVGEYLRQRFDLPAAEPTPPEAEAQLLRRGCAAELAERAGAFFRACDAVRFGPEREGMQLADEARQLILAVEAATWAPGPS